MAEPQLEQVDSYHAHVYFDAGKREAAQELRDAVTENFDIQMGRWHEKMVGPHPRWSYQIAFKRAQFDELVPWLMLNRRDCTIFLHPNSGNDLEDHRDCAVWMGEMLPLNLGMFE